MRGSPFSFTNFSRGLNVLDSPYTLNDGEARDVLNMVSTPRGAIKKRYGSLLFGSASFGSFPTPAATDNFNRANGSPGANWSSVFGLSVGEIFENQWLPIPPGQCAARWNVGEQTNPAVSVEMVVVGRKTMSLWTCLDAAGNNGYGLRVEGDNTLENNTIKLRLRVGGVSTTLAELGGLLFKNGDSIGIGVREGKVGAFWKSSGGGGWNLLLTTSDTSFTKGYAAIEADGRPLAPASYYVLDNFVLAEMPVSPASSEFTSLLPCRVPAGNFLIAVSGKKIFSVSESGEITDITDGLAVTEGVRWSIIQSTSGAPNRVVADGPIYLSNGVDPPRYWSGAAKGTVVAEWTAKPEGLFQAVPKAKYLTYLANRVWASGIAGDTSAVRFSGFAVKAEEGEQADPTNWPKENVVWFEKEDGEVITGTGIAGSYLMVFKPHKTWAVYDLNEGENRRLSDNVGCISYRSIVETPQGTFFLTPDQGVYVTNGTTLREVSRNVRPILQGIDPNTFRAAKQDQLENAAAAYLNGHYYLSYMAQDGTQKTLDYDTALQSWWLHDLAGNQWVHWEPKAGTSTLYTIPGKAKGGIIKAFVQGVYQDQGVNYVGGHGLSCYWLSPWEPFFQYVLRHRINQPQTKKRIRTLFVDGKGELVTVVARKFGSALETLKGVVDNADMAAPASPVTLGNETNDTQAVRYYSLGTSRVWSFGFGNASAAPIEIDAYACDLSFRKS